MAEEGSGTLHYLLCKQKVTDFNRWHAVFASHAAAQREAGLHLLHLLRDVVDPSTVIFLFRVDDPEKAKAFTEAPEAGEAAETSGVVAGTTEISLLIGD